MNTSQRVCWIVLSAALVLLLGNQRAVAQKEATPSRVVEEIDDAKTVRLQGNVHPLARMQNDIGGVADSQPMQRMLLLLQRSPEQETSIRQLLDAQQTKGVAGYHAWLTPEQFGKHYGPSDADVQAVTDWLTRQGFQVAKVAAGRTAIEFNGNAQQVRNAFHTDIHRFVVNGEEHFANVSDPEIPEALAPVVAGVVALHNFPKEHHLRSRGVYRRNKETSELTPLFTYGSPVNFAVGPGDFATIYNIPVGADGTGQSIAVVGQSNINPQDVISFRHMFGLDQKFPANNVTVIVNGPDPGIVGPATPGATSDEGESDLDVEMAGGIAPNAQILFVTSQSTQSNPNQVSAGVDLSALYIVDNNLAPVMSESYGQCEGELGAAGNGFYSQLWQQAAAQGITVVVSSGDNGSAGCDPDPNGPKQNAAAHGVAVSGVASTPYNVGVGGTDFDSSTTTSTSTYWNLTSGMVNSALKYMPETTWNDSTCAINYPAACISVDSKGADISAGSGGPSNCLQSSISNDVITCTTNTTFPNGIGYSKPPWQTGSSITPTDGVRDLPDVSLFASNGQNGVAVVLCQSDANPNGASCNLNSPYQDFSLAGGTSAAAPAFAAIMALVNQKTGQRQGNANFVLYGLASMDTNYTGGKCVSSVGSTPAAGCVFNDVGKGNNSVACVAGTPNCSNTGTSGFGVLIYSKDNGNPAFQSVAGYDLATGLGSINVTNLLAKWSSVTRIATTTTLTSTHGATNVSGQTFSVNVTVGPSGATGDVSLIGSTPGGQAAFGPFTLSNGAVTASTNLLPPGTTAIAAYYGGDITHAASMSAQLPLAVTGSGQASTTTLSFVTFDSNNNPILSTSPQPVSYGTSYVLQIKVQGSMDCAFGYPNTKPPVPCPTGTVALTDNGSPLNDYPNGPTSHATNMAKLNNLGIAENQPIQLAPGSHSIAAAYVPGDSNYQNSTSNTLSVMVNKATTTTSVSGNPSTITAGMSVTLTAYEVTSSNGAGPTGTVQFSNGSTNLGAAVTCTPTSGAQDTSPPISQIKKGTAYCTATLTTTISALYPPPQRGPETPGVPVMPIAIVGLCAALYLAALRCIPESRRRAYAYAGLVVFALLAVGIAGCGGGGGSSGGGGKGSRTINAAYSGDMNYAASTGMTTITIP